MEQNEKKNRKRIPLTMLCSSSWSWPNYSVESRVELEHREHGLNVEDDCIISTSHYVFDPKEPLLNVKHQEITKIPHETRGEVIRSLKGRGFIRKVCKSILKPVDVDAQCCLIVSRYFHGQPLPVFAD